MLRGRQAGLLACRGLSCVMCCVGQGSSAVWQGQAPLGCCRGPERAASLPFDSPCSDCKSDENWTCITFYPDLERFGMEGAGSVLAHLLGSSADALRGIPPRRSLVVPEIHIKCTAWLHGLTTSTGTPCRAGGGDGGADA